MYFAFSQTNIYISSVCDLKINGCAQEETMVSTKKHLYQNIKSNIPLLLMVMPGTIYLLVFKYVPIYGIVIAFKDFRIDPRGFWYSLFNSSWVGFKNFQFLFLSQDTKIFIRNTIAYSLAWLFICLVVQIAFAIILTEMTNRKTVKVLQTMMLFPHFISMVIVSSFVFIFLSSDKGIVNALLKGAGLDAVQWYMEPGYWPLILTIIVIWKGTGYGSIIYIATITGFDQELFEAAIIDGASKWQQITRVTLPLLKPVVSIMLILGLSGILSSDFGLFYAVPRQSTMLLSATSVIDTYVYRALINMGSITLPAAAGLFKSLVGFILIIVTNAIVRKINPENSLF
jgi:putative aldouronate transport system permease protein